MANRGLGQELASKISFFSSLTPPIVKIVCVKNVRTWVSMVSYLKNLKEIMLKISIKSRWPF